MTRPCCGARPPACRRSPRWTWPALHRAGQADPRGERWVLSPGLLHHEVQPRVNEEAAAQPGFTQLHPLQPVETVQGALEVLYTAEQLLCEITGMDGMSFQPAIRPWRVHRPAPHPQIPPVPGDSARTKILVPDAAHGTNPASATMAGFDVVSIPSNPQGRVDLDALRQAVGRTPPTMLTNPNTVGLFDANILEITQIVHDAGGLCYYDGANLNAVMGHVRPGDMGFDCVHLNLHKTFSTPHGGGGPGSGPVGCKAMLEPFLPTPGCRRRRGAIPCTPPPRPWARCAASMATSWWW